MKRTTKTVAIAAGVLVVGLAAGMLLAQGRSESLATGRTPTQTASVQALPVADPSSLQSLQLSFREVAQRIIPSVVEINVTEMVNQPTQDFSFPFPFPFGQQQPQGGSQRVPVSALGSGIIVQHTGNRYFVLTNNHVVDSATQVSVRLNDQRTYKATVLGKDPLKDLAMVAFDTSDSIPVAALGDSNSLQVGDIVLAVGNPFGYTDTVTMGIVSALGRRGPPGQQPSTYTSYIQTDAAINQGNSGGALVNVDGQVVGINTWIAAPNGGNIGLGFAIPIDTAKTDVQQLATKGQVQYGWMGVEISDIQDSATYPGYATDLKLQGVNGAMVMDVYKGSPAAEGGVLPGDYVTAVDSTPIQNADQLTQVVGNLIAGRTYTFSVLRDGTRTDLRVKI
ncbi:MAG TPA: trypsin-like peptidase domain-containing protein, partial [Spirochaetia bacterium]|nr:trypsin-like peptidase domain-containing protein [Spirochaetia bacterium]